MQGVRPEKGDEGVEGAQQAKGDPATIKNSQTDIVIDMPLKLGTCVVESNSLVQCEVQLSRAGKILSTSNDSPNTKEAREFWKCEP